MNVDSGKDKHSVKLQQAYTPDRGGERCWKLFLFPLICKEAIRKLLRYVIFCYIPVISRGPINE